MILRLTRLAINSPMSMTMVGMLEQFDIAEVVTVCRSNSDMIMGGSSRGGDPAEYIEVEGDLETVRGFCARHHYQVDPC